jgi:hypothetical protein
VTWGNGATGVSGVVSAANSLVGSTADDFVIGVAALPSGNYVVTSLGWDNGAIVNAGAVTWCNGATGTVGSLSAANSLVGSATDDRVGENGITILSNGNYVVRSRLWNNGAVVDAGAVTWGSGTSGVSGVVSAANSLVGSQAGDAVGFPGVTVLTNGNYVVRSTSWDNGAIVDAGAVTRGNGTSGTSGVVSASNSLVGSTAGDFVGNGGVTALTNGHYVVLSPSWDNGASVDVGALTWRHGSAGVNGAVTTSNSVVGSATGDFFGVSDLVALANGNYVARFPQWDNGGIVNAGAEN